MKNLYKALIYDHLKIHGLLFALLLGAVATQRTLTVNIVGPGLALYVWLCFMLFSFKPFCAKSWSWLKTLPISRMSLLFLVVSESLFVVPMAILVFSSIYLLSYSFDLLKITSGLSGTNWYYLALYIFALSPSLVVVFQPVTAKSFGWNYNAKTVLGWSILLFVSALTFYVAPILTATLAGAAIMGGMGRYGLNSIFPQRSLQKWANGYGIFVGLSILAILVCQVELSAEKEARPALRMKYYGFLAPQIDRQTLFSILARPDLEDSSRIEIARFKQSKTEGIGAWSEKASVNRVFIQGLTLFQEDVWSPDALVQLENAFKDRCHDGLQKSKWAPIWRCEVAGGLLGLGGNALNLVFRVKDGPELLDLLNAEHPLISSLLIQASLISGGSESWKPKIEALATAKVPVVSDQAQMWLDRLRENPEGIWDCSGRRRKKGAVCLEAGSISGVGLKIESKVANDPGGSVSIGLVRDK